MKELRHFCLFLAVLICSLQYSIGIDAPDNVAVSNEGSTDSLKVTWAAPDGATSQEVTWSLPEGLGSSGNISGTANEHNITGLTPGTLYDVTVTAFDGADENSTDPVEGRTKPSPANLMESGATNESISASWTKPDGVVDQYLVSCSNGTVEPNSPIMDEDTTTTYNASCVGLSTAGANYTITVTSQSGSEKSSESPITITALPNSVHLMEGNATIDSVSATWVKPAGEVSSYEIECIDGDALPPLINDTGEGLFSASCENLTIPGKEYTMSVTSVSNGQNSDVATIALRALPSQVTDLSEFGATHDSVSARWTKPDGVVTSYNVTCPDESTQTIQENSDDGVRTVTCEGLPEDPGPGGNHTIVVITMSGDKASAPAAIIITASPSPVTGLDELGATTDSVSATWSKPPGVVTSYNATCPDGTVKVEPENGGDGSRHNVTCDGLQQAGADYIITVIAISGNKASDPRTVTITALPARVSLTEESDMVTTTTITASWSNATGVFDYYEVSCSNGTASPDRVNPTDDLIASCTGLTIPGDDYDISVTTVSSGQRSETDTITITALPDAVTLVGGLSNNTAISATWTVEGVVDNFTITCSNGTAFPSSIPVASSPTDDEFTAYCTGLPTPGLEYFLSVGAFSNNKPGAIRTVGVHASPSGVTLEEGPSTTTSVSATWMDPDGAVERYNITCSDGVASPETIRNTTQSSYSASCVNLSLPGDTYTMTVYSFVDNGTTSSSALINLIALPAMVTDLSESGATNDSVTANWTKPRGVVTSYNATCSDGSTQTVPEDNDNSTHMVSCDGLQTAGADYNITVIAISGNKASDPANVTITAYPNSVVLRAGEITTTQITVLWDDPNGVEDSFIVDCADDGTTDVTLYPGNATNDMFQAACDVPMAGAPFNITVISVSGDKQSPFMDTFTAATPSAVTIVDMSSNTTSITVSWNALSSADGFEVDCSNGTSMPNSSLPGSATQATCDGVTPGGNHSVSIVTVENNGRSPATVTYVVAVPLSADLDASASTTTSVSAMWPYPGGLVDVFEVVCSNGTESNATVVVGPTDLDTSYLVSCDDVYNPGDNYTMIVTSISNEQENSASIVLTALPLSVVLVSSVSTITSVSATWEFPGGIVDEFEVECSNGTEDFPIADSDEGYRASCEGLDNPGDDYTMTVSSLSNLQRNSALIVLTALPGAVNLTEVSADVTTTSITASWSNATGVFDYYEVSCSNGTASPARVNPSDDLIASCTGLPTPGDDYAISVTTVSNGLYSETDTIRITALPEAVELMEGASNTSVISASWTVPSSVVDTFNITCSAGTASPSSVDSSPAGELLMAYCIDLPRSGEEYFLSVVAISKNKQSAVSTIGVFALPLGVDLEEGPSTLTSVSATWMRQNDTVESYSIRCSQGDASPSTIEDTSQQSYSASCVNLTGPGATYTMFVYSEVGTNTSSNSTRASSLINLVAVPESVESILVAEYTTTTANVGWQLKDCPTCVYNRFILTFEPDSQAEIVVDYRTDVPQYSSQVSNLTQGRSYNFTVVSESGVNVQSATPKTSEEQSVEQRTVPATPVGLNVIPDQRSLSLNWSYVGDADDFIITIMPSHGTAAFNGDLVNPAGEVTGLTPGTEYQVSVVTISGDKRSEPQTEDTRTLTDKPSPVQNPRAVPENKTTITLTYESPAEPNGIIEFYRINYSGTRENLRDHLFPPYETVGPVLAVTFDGLYPGYTYTFTIIAVNDGGLESDPVSTEAVTPEEEPPPVPEDYPYTENTVHSERLTTRFTVELPRDLFSHENGELMTFSVIITTQANDADVQSTERTYNDRSQGAYITIFRMAYPYPPSFESSRRRRATESNVEVVIGNETCSGSSSEYCNGPLNDNTRYYYAFRAYNSRGSTTSGTFGPVNTVKDNTTGIAVGVSMSLFAIIFVIAVGAFVTMRRRKRNTCNSQRPSLEGNENRGFIPPGDDQEMRKMKRKPGSSMYRKSHSKPVLLTNFEDHYRRMKADSDFKFTEEYDEIRQVGKGQPIVAALEMVNRAKNRFTNILPYEHSRVKLAALADEPDTDYINANYMPGYGGPREFIACQGPLPGTVDDMWRMIWEKNTSIVVMLTQLVEMGKIKCHQYWPENYNPVTYGTIEVTMQAVQQFDHWVIREFTLVKGDDIRKLTQYHFMSWPDHGVPNQTSFMLDFVRTVREAIQKVNSENPTVVHCSAGVGRTGTYIALDRLMQMMQEHDFVDIFGIICEMRMQRNLMVQTEKQYIFIHECVMDLLRREDGDTGESIYVNFNANGYNGDVSKNLLDQAV